MMIKEASNTTLSSNKEKEGEHENCSTANKVSTKMAERTEPDDGHDITTAVTKATTVGWMLDNTDNSSTTKLQPAEEAQIDMGKVGMLACCSCSYSIYCKMLCRLGKVHPGPHQARRHDPEEDRQPEGCC